jgi:release factor glutamine methyltransferase
MSTLGACLRDAEAQLGAVSETPRLDAEVLLAHALGLSRAQLLARLREAAIPPQFAALLDRRMASEPVAYIVGQCEFYSMEFRVRPPVLIPRPETELLVELALEQTGALPAKVLDLCAGSGCIGISIAKHAPAATVYAVDIADSARVLTHENAALHAVPITFFQGDLFDALPAAVGPFDCIVSNPPYVEESAWSTLPKDIRAYEAREALVAGADGLDVIRRIIRQAPPWLRPGGLLAVEIDGAQEASVIRLMAASGFADARSIPDLAGIPRVVRARRV